MVTVIVTVLIGPGVSTATTLGAPRPRFKLIAIEIIAMVPPSKIRRLDTNH